MIDEGEWNVGPGAGARGCPPPEHVASLAGDALPDDLRAAVAAHVARCAACRSLAADLAMLAEAEVPASLQARVRAESTSRGRWALLAAAALLSAIGLAAWWQVRKPEPRPQEAKTVAVPPPTVPTPAARWSIDKPVLVLPAATVLVMRGADRTAEALGAALEPYRHDDFRGAAASLDAFTKTHPDSGDAWFYLGASRLLIGEDADGRTALEKAAALGAGGAHVELPWLIATAEARTGATDSARARLTTLCGNAGRMNVRACDALRALR